MATAKDILDRKGREVVTMVPGESVLNAARLMNERSIGGIVVAEDDRMVGIFTERDILRRVVAEQLDPAKTTVGDVMTSPVISLKSSATLEECMGLITEKRVRHLPVLDDDGLEGIVTSGDVLAYQVREQQDTIEYLHSYVYNPR
ncbi:MAG: CBS domain-containing protein [Gemmatimonadales bacterium]|jgi:CBS domain-containing protein